MGLVMENALELYLRNADIIMLETGIFDDFVELKNNINDNNLVLIFMLGYFASNQYYTNKLKELLKENKTDLKLSDLHTIISEISSKPLS